MHIEAATFSPKQKVAPPQRLIRAFIFCLINNPADPSSAQSRTVIMAGFYIRDRSKIKTNVAPPYNIGRILLRITAA
jgi:hypothetical protein